MKDFGQLFKEIEESNPKVKMEYEKLIRRDGIRKEAYDRGFYKGRKGIIIECLKDIGVIAMDSNDQLRNPEDILGELGEKLDKLKGCSHEWKLTLISDIFRFESGITRCSKHFKCIKCGAKRDDKNVEE